MMNKSNKTKATRKLSSAVRHVTTALDLLREAGEILPEDQQVGLARALEKLMAAQVVLSGARSNAGKTFEEVYPEPKAETVEERLERQNSERLAGMGMQ